MMIDGQLRELIGKIEHSHLSQKEKDDVYASISFGLRAAVWPVLAGHMLEDELSALSKDAARVAPEVYARMISLAVEDPSTEGELVSLMQAALVGVEKVLKGKYII